MRFLKWGLGLAIVCLAMLAANLLWFKPFSIGLYFEREFIRFALDNPELLSQLGVLDGTPFDFYNDDLTDASLEQLDESLAQARDSLETLRRYDREALSAKDQLSYDVFEWFLADQAAGERFKLHGYAIMQNSGAYLDIVDFMSRVHRIADAGGARDYLTRLAAVGTKLHQQLDLSKLQAEQGIVPPRFIIAKILGNLHNIRDVPAAESSFVVSFRERLAGLGDVDAATRDELEREALGLVDDSVYPAYDDTIAFFEALLPKATDDAGVWKLPDGDAYYRHRIRSSTTTDLTAEEIHRLGLAEVARIEAQMSAILAEQGYTGAPVGDLMEQLSSEERFLRPNTSGARKELVAEYQTIVDEISAGIRSAFHLVPEAPLEVRRIPEYREQTAASHYNPASLDGSRPAIFFAKLAEIPPRFTMRTLAYHEGVPGHHFQIGIQMEQTGVPTFRKVLPFTAFTEGWALYAERLASEMGYQADPFDDLGRLEAELFRAVRLVVDTGLHHERWTRQQALDYMRLHTGDEHVSEVERYCVWPGQALAYKVGMLKILELRERAKTELGEAFDLAEFHDVVIGNGSLPLAILERLVDEYLAEQVGG